MLDTHLHDTRHSRALRHRVVDDEIGTGAGLFAFETDWERFVHRWEVENEALVLRAALSTMVLVAKEEAIDEELKRARGYL